MTDTPTNDMTATENGAPATDPTLQSTDEAATTPETAAAPTTDNGAPDAAPSSDLSSNASPDSSDEAPTPDASGDAASDEGASSAEAPSGVDAAAAEPTASQDADAGSPRRGRQPSMEQVMESDEFAAYMSGAETLERNTLVSGTVVRLEENGSILVDISHKSEGIIPRNEAGEEDVNVGDSVECVVIRSEDEEGHPVLSKRRADYERTKRELVAARENGEVRQATVKEAVKGGIIVDLGVAAFVPASHVDQRQRSQLERLIGQVVPVKVIEVDFRKNRDKVIASHRLAVEEEREKNRTEALASLEKDKIVEGVVRRITDFGAFIDLGGVDGLLHVREMAWGRVDHPSSVVKKGQKLQVLVLDIDEERDRIALGLKQLLPDPWKKAAKNYKVGQVVPVKILRLAPTVAFAELEPGVEAIIPISEMSEERIKEPEDVLTIGQEIEGRIKSIQPNQRRITVSLRAAVQERERRETRSAVREVNQRAQEDSQVRLGDLFGKELRALRNRRRDDARAEAEAAADDEDLDTSIGQEQEDVSVEANEEVANAESVNEEVAVASSEESGPAETETDVDAETDVETNAEADTADTEASTESSAETSPSAEDEAAAGDEAQN